MHIMIQSGNKFKGTKFCGNKISGNLTFAQLFLANFLVSLLIQNLFDRAAACQSLMNKEGIRIDGNLEIANCLNSHFSSVGLMMAENIESLNMSARDPLSYIKKDVDRSLFLNYTSSVEIFERISKLQNKKSSGYDLISNNILKSTNLTISPYLEIFKNNDICPFWQH